MIAGVDGTAYPQYRQQLAAQYEASFVCAGETPFHLAWRKRHAAHTSNHHTFIGHNLDLGFPKAKDVAYIYNIMNLKFRTSYPISCKKQR
jgi:hypothetical protein